MLLLTEDVSRLSAVHCGLIKHFLTNHQPLNIKEWDVLSRKSAIFHKRAHLREYDAYVKWL
jgi:hypothetical protein